jgi:hypothetical protein
MSDSIYHGARTTTWNISLVKNANWNQKMNMLPYSRYRQALLSLMEGTFLEPRRSIALSRCDPFVRDGPLATFCRMLFKGNCEPFGSDHIFVNVFLIALK